jgi:hypothetical protein
MPCKSHLDMLERDGGLGGVHERRRVRGQGAAALLRVVQRVVGRDVQVPLLLQPHVAQLRALWTDVLRRVVPVLSVSV